MSPFQGFFRDFSKILRIPFSALNDCFWMTGENGSLITVEKVCKKKNNNSKKIHLIELQFHSVDLD